MLIQTNNDKAIQIIKQVEDTAKGEADIKQTVWCSNVQVSRQKDQKKKYDLTINITAVSVFFTSNYMSLSSNTPCLKNVPLLFFKQLHETLANFDNFWQATSKKT